MHVVSINKKQGNILVNKNEQLVFLAFVGYEELCRSRRVLSTEAEERCYPPRPKAKVQHRLKVLTHLLRFCRGRFAD